MKALVCPNEPVPNGYRIAQVEPDDKIFAVADPLYWMDCNDDVIADESYFDTTEEIIKVIKGLTKLIVTANNQPVTTGSQTL